MAAAEHVIKLDASEIQAVVDSARGPRHFTARNSDGKNAELFIFDDIGESFFDEGITGKSVNAALKGMGNVDTITVHINSPGGAVFDGLAIYNLLAQHKAKIVVEIDGLAASAASVIAMAGDEIRMAENALMMIHPASSMAFGTADDMRDTADILEKITDNLVNIYAARTGRPREQIAELVDMETWLNASDALDLGLITDITPDKAVAAHAVAHLRGDSNKVFFIPKAAIDDAMSLFPTHEENVATFNRENPPDSTPVHVGRKQQNTTQGTQMEWFKALGYESEAQAVAAFSEIKTFQNGVVSATGASSPADAVARLTELTNKVDTLSAELTASKVQAESVKVESQIAELTASMRLAPAMHDWFRGLDAKGREGFAANAAPVVKSPKAPTEMAGDDLVLNQAQEDMIVACELDRDAFIAQVKIDQKASY